MGSFVQIVRTEKGQKRPITASELQQLALVRDDMKVERTPSGSKAEAYVYWPELSSSEPCMSLHDGELTTFNPDERIMRWLFDLASSLNGRVRDDEYATYLPNGVVDVHPDDAALRSEALALGAQAKHHARKRTWLLNLSIFAVFGLLAVLANQCSN